MAVESVGTIRIDGNADSFNRAIKDVNKGLESTEDVAKNSASGIMKGFKESSITIANNFLNLAGQIK